MTIPTPSFDGGVNSLSQLEAIAAHYNLLSADVGPNGTGVTVTAAGYQIQATNTWFSSVGGGALCILPETSQPEPLPGLFLFITNTSSNPLLVYPFQGDPGKVINGAANVTLGGNSVMLCHCFSPGQWFATQIASGSASQSTFFTPQMFNANAGDGITECSAAIKSAVNAAAAYGSAGNTSGEVLFPPGIYIIGTSACLTPSIGSISSIKYRGCGQSASILQFGTLSSDTWFYDNGSTGNQTSFMSSFYDLGFRGSGSISNFASIPTHAKGFRLVGNTAETSFRFYNCEISGLNLCYSMEGTNLASDMNFFGCRFVTIQDFYVISNPQSFLHHFFGCEWEIYGEAFIIVNGGGSIALYGGSVICLDEGNGIDQYFIDFFGNTAAFGGQPLVISGVRFELRGPHNNLVSVSGNITGKINFSDCTLEDQSTTKPAWVTIANQMVLTFTRCVFFDINSTDPFRFQVNGSDTYGQTGDIFFDSCVVPVDLSSKCSLPTGHGSIRAINCTGDNVDPHATSHWAHDFTFHGNFAKGQAAAWSTAGTNGDGGGTDARWVKHVAQIKLSSELWPSDQEPKLLLPANAIIVGIHIRKPPGGSSTTTQLQITNSDKTVTHVQTNSANWSTTVLTADLTDYYYCVGTLTNDRTLRLSSTVNTSGSFVTGGFAIIEYY